MSPEDFRARLGAMGLSQMAAARALEIDPRTVRRYAAGDLPVTRVIELALDGVAAAKEDK